MPDRHNHESSSDSPKGDDRDRLLHASRLMLPVMRIRSVVITPKPSMRRFFYLLLALLPAPARVFHNGVHSAVAPALHHAQRAAMPAAGVSRESGRRPSRVGQVVRAELATVIRTANSVGSKRIPAGLQSMISIVDVDMSPDLRNARVKVSIIGDRKDKITAGRWLLGNTRGPAIAPRASPVPQRQRRSSPSVPLSPARAVSAVPGSVSPQLSLPGACCTTLLIQPAA